MKHTKQNIISLLEEIGDISYSLSRDLEEDRKIKGFSKIAESGILRKSKEKQQMKMTDEKINELIDRGASRWTKGGYDRLYINPEIVGLECDYYKSGNISYAKFNGEKISNSMASKIKASKTYVDINTGKLHSTCTVEAFTEAVKALLGFCPDYEVN